MTTLKMLLCLISALFLMNGFSQDNTDYFNALFDDGNKELEKYLSIYPTNNITSKELRVTLSKLMKGERTPDKKVSLLKLDQINAKIKDNPLFKSWLYNKKGYIFQTQENYKDAVKMFIASTNMLDSLYSEVTVERQETLLMLASSYYRLGDKENADKAFFEAMKFPYYVFPTNDVKVLRRLEEAHRRAIMGLILCRAGDVRKLNEIRIIPAANDLRPKLEEAIKRAEGNLENEE